MLGVASDRITSRNNTSISDENAERLAEVNIYFICFKCLLIP